jgi:hypothetical protein
VRSLRNRLSCTALIAVFACSQLHAGTLVLSSKFVKKLESRATISIQLEVDEHLTTPHRIGKSGDDGDVHMAGRSAEVRLPLVVEIVNARLEKKSMQLLNESSPDTKIDVTGVWRLWFEHPAKDEMIQGNPVDKPGDSNPDHVFEVHPVTKFEANSALDSFVPITSSKGKAYEAYSAAAAFPKYEALTSTIENTGTSISITSARAGYNYTEFIIQLAGKPKEVPDGFFVLAQVFDTNEEEEPVIPAVRRMVFVKGTPPADEVKKMGKGGRLHVLGIPRVNLAEVAAVPVGDPVQMSLPYEMIIVAVLPD